MNKGARYREQVLDEAFFGVPLPWLATDVFDLSLHTAEPQDEAGNLTNEVAYGGYQRARLPRNLLTWARNGNRVTNRIEARFALCQEDGKRTATHWALTPSGQAAPTYRGAFEKAIVIEAGIRPVVDAGMIEAIEA